MRLVSFQVKDFRSVNDSGEIPVGERTALVGRNESGKTSVLLALASLKPHEENLRPFTLSRDFPRDRARNKFDPSLRMLFSSWELDDEERAQLASHWKRAKQATYVSVSRDYAGKYYIGIGDVVGPSELVARSLPLVEKVSKAGKAKRKANDPAGTQIEQLLKRFDSELAYANDDTLAEWGERLESIVTGLRALASGDGPLASVAEDLEALHLLAVEASEDTEAHRKARLAVISMLPTFVYLEDWENVPGHHDINAFLQRKAQNAPTADDALFEKLLRVAGLDATELQSSLNGSHEDRTLLTDRASRVFTKILREFWKDRTVDVQFRVDANHFDVVVSDEDNTALTQLDQRSRGFRWYFSFFVTFAADTKGGDKSNAILLLDEPGLFLHARAQGALLKYFADLPNQIVYTTHSPFMIDVHQLDSVRTVMLEPDKGTVVNVKPAGDDNTLFPLQAALGYELSQTLFIGPDNAIVEGVTDYWYLSGVAEYLRAAGRPSLDQAVVLTPAGGASRVPLLAVLLAAQKLKVAVLLDSDSAGDESLKDLLTSKLVRESGIVRVAEAWEKDAPTECEIEDLFSRDVFLTLVSEAYAKELAGVPLVLNEKIPRIARQLDKAFEARGLEFHKSRVANLFLRKLGTDGSKLLDAETLGRFERIIRRVNDVVAKARKVETPFR